jgi:hypothetical protein
MKRQLVYTTNFSLKSSLILKMIVQTGLIVPILVIMCLFSTSAQAQFTWAVKTTNKSQKAVVEADQDGNSYTLSPFTGSLTIGGQTFTSLGSTDLLLVKYNSSGAVVWARRIGSTGEEEAGDIAFSQAEGALYLTGSFESTVKLDTYPGSSAGQLSTAGNSDVLVAKYNLQGSLVWARRTGGTSEDNGLGISLDNSQNVYLTGSFNGTIVLPSNILFNQSLVSKGNSDIFLMKYNAQGSFQLGRALGGTGYDMGMAITVDPTNGDIYLAGGYSPATNPSITNASIAKFTKAGTLQWNKVSGSGATIDVATDIFMTAQGVYITGYFGNTIAFDNISLASNGSADIFVAYYPTIDNGKAAWAKRFGGSDWDEAQSLRIVAGDIYLAGTFKGTATFGQTTLHAKSGATDKDIFVSCLSLNGNPIWAQSIGSSALDYGRGNIAGPINNTLFYTGHYGAAFTLGASNLSGSGNLLTKITLPSINSFYLYNATTDTQIKSLPSGSTINYMVTGTNQINIRAEGNNSVGSVKFVLNGKVYTDNGNTFAPCTYPGDALKSGGGIDYLPTTLAEGEYKLEATPYSGPNGTGIKGVTKMIIFKITNKSEISGLTLINAATDTDIKPLLKGADINFTSLGTNQLSIRANTNPVKVGSVKFVLDSKEKIENTAPYTIAGDAAKTGGIDYLPFTPAPGYHTLSVTAYSGSNGTGIASNTYTINFYVNPGNTRFSFVEEEPQMQPVSVTAAPNPFTDYTAIAFTPALDGVAKVEIISMQGMLIEQLYDGEVKAGQAYSWQFNGSGLPAGMYIARIQVGEQAFTQKLVLSQ